MTPRLTGSHPQTMDDKSRLAVPARLIPALRELSGSGEKQQIEVVITVTAQQRLGVYPRQLFMQMIERLEQAPAEDQDVADLRITLLNNMDEQCLDKQNRFRVPAAYGRAFDLNGEVIVLGSGEFLEVVNKEAWQAQLAERMSQMPSKLRAVSQLLRPPATPADGEPGRQGGGRA